MAKEGIITVMKNFKHWNFHEINLVKHELNKIENGDSIYGVVKALYVGQLRHRSWESIRQKVNELRRREAREMLLQ